MKGLRSRFSFTNIVTLHIDWNGFACNLFSWCEYKEQYRGDRYWSLYDSHNLFGITFLPTWQISIAILNLHIGWIMNEAETGLEFKMKFGEL